MGSTTGGPLSNVVLIFVSSGQDVSPCLTFDSSPMHRRCMYIGCSVSSRLAARV